MEGNTSSWSFKQLSINDRSWIDLSICRNSCEFVPTKNIWPFVRDTERLTVINIVIVKYTMQSWASKYYQNGVEYLIDLFYEIYFRRIIEYGGFHCLWHFDEKFGHTAYISRKHMFKNWILNIHTMKSNMTCSWVSGLGYEMR